MNLVADLRLLTAIGTMLASLGAVNPTTPTNRPRIFPQVGTVNPDAARSRWNPGVAIITHIIRRLSIWGEVDTVMEARMTRSKTRRTFRLESLESRALLSSGGPSAEEQYMLEMINKARTDPAEMASWIQSNLDPNDMATIQHYGVDLNATLSTIANSTPVQPLAWSDTLGSTAQEQSQYESDNQVQTHQGPGEADLGQRLQAAGYSNPAQYGENSYAYAQSVNHAMKAFLIDWGVSDNGHRANLLEPGTSDGQTYSEVGIGIVDTPSGSQVGPEVITQDFGRPQNFTPQVVGVVYNDQNNNGMYDVGEGQGGVQIVVTDGNGQQVAQTTTWDAGGYQIPLSPGSYTVTALVNNQIIQSKNVTIGGDNVEVDFNTNQPWQGGSLPSPTTQAQPQPQPKNQVQVSTMSVQSSSTSSSSDNSNNDNMSNNNTGGADSSSSNTAAINNTVASNLSNMAVTTGADVPNLNAALASNWSSWWQKS
jgi:uncharacterized protein YkwD